LSSNCSNRYVFVILFHLILLVFHNSEYDKYVWRGTTPTQKQLEQMRTNGLYGRPNFPNWFKQRAIQDPDIHPDLRQLSYGSVTVKSYGRYDVNGYRFRSVKFETSRPLAATCNTGVVSFTRDASQNIVNYYGVIQDILEFTFAGNKDLKLVFFKCDWFDPIRGTRENRVGMV
jgi:hypothetical protein